MKDQVFWEVPEGYRLYHDLNLAEDRKSLTVLAISQLVAIVLLIAIGILVCPLRHAFDMEAVKIVAGLGFLCIGIVVYIVAHEWVHGMAIRFITGRQADFGFDLKKGMAYAGSDAYFGKAAYIIIALAPLMFWGITLFVILWEVAESWFWYLYAIQIMNISGSVGDLYVTGLTLRAPKGTIVRDSGTSMLFYVSEEE
ncbi:MAG: DUF3267 domain-containing protein [Firmicutes bacterium]|nr:DUF3267 domain-containing protein [Bacillota bacterium]